MLIYIGTAVLAAALIYWFFLRSSEPAVTLPKRNLVAGGVPKIPTFKKKKKQDVRIRETLFPGTAQVLLGQDDDTVTGNRLSVFFYSQTGTAEDFSRRLADDGKLYGFHTKVYDVEDYDTERFNASKHEVVIFCAATYGEGDPPENAVQFHEWLLEEDRDEELMKGTKFAVFGLGDKTYEHFNKMGRVLDKQLEKLGGVRLHARGEGDSDGNIEEDFLKWKKGFWSAFAKEFNVEKKEGPVQRKATVTKYEAEDPAIAGVDVHNIARWRQPVSATATAPAAARRRTYDTRNPLLARIVVNRELHGKDSGRSCRHVEIDIANELNYEAGDHVAIFPQNSPTLVHQLAARLNIKLEDVFSIYSIDDKRTPIVGPCTYMAALTQFYDLLLPPRKPMLRVLADYTIDEEEKKKLLKLASDDPDDQEYFNKYIQDDLRTIFEVLKDFPGVKPPVDHFLEVMPRLQPRFYSISSSPNVHKGNVHVTAVLVEFVTPTKRVHKGVCTHWLSQQIPSDDKTLFVPIFIRKSNFHLPAQLSTPIIMVGPGTGVAPFRGFLHERKHRLAQATTAVVMENHLFFGCRHPDQDYLYKEELEQLETDKVAIPYLAFSRQNAQKVYVQHLMTQPETATKIYTLLNGTAYLYICGEAKNMAKDVTHALKQVLQSQGNMSAADADKFMQRLSDRNRSFSDVW